jgi:hypothetical protein
MLHNPVSHSSHDSDHKTLPSREDIAERAYRLWVKKGYPEDSAEENWLQAERELRDASLSRRLTKMADENAGSVQR